MGKKIDGHVQWNGAAWVFYLKKQEGKPCETEGCVSCKKASKELMEKIEAQEQKDAEALKVEVDRVAGEKKVKDEAEVVLNHRRESGRLKHSAVRSANIKMQEALEEAKEHYDKHLREAQAVHDKACDEALRSHEEKKIKAIAANKKMLEAIAKTDWLAKASGK